MLGFDALGRLALGEAPGQASIAGVLSVTLGDATLSAAGAVALAGTASVTLADATVSASGAVAIVGVAAVTLDGVGLSATGALAVSGALAADLDAATVSATGVLGIAAVLAATLDDAIVVAAGRDFQTITDTEVIHLPVDYFMEGLPQYRRTGRTFEPGRGEARVEGKIGRSGRRRLSAAGSSFTTRTDKRGYD